MNIPQRPMTAEEMEALLILLILENLDLRRRVERLEARTKIPARLARATSLVI